jgi:hypothetical protein
MKDRWKGIQKILRLQWRIIILTVALVIEGLYFSSQGWAQENQTATAARNPKALAFGACLVSTHGNHTACQSYADFIPISKPAVLAGIFVMAVSRFSRGA